MKHQEQVAILSKALRVIYQQSGTIGVLRRCDGMQEYRAETLILAALDASQGDKGVASGIINGLLGSCCYQDEEDHNETGARQACALMQAYDDQKGILEPDLVALSLAFVATT